MVDILQEDVETLGLVGSPGFPHGLYVADHFLSGEKGKLFNGLRGVLSPLNLLIRDDSMFPIPGSEKRSRSWEGRE